jgi:hypothetical protein
MHMGYPVRVKKPTGVYERIRFCYRVRGDMGYTVCSNLTSPCLNPVRRPFFLGICSIGTVLSCRRYPKISSTSYVNVDVFKDQYEEKIQEIWQNWLKPY